MIVDDDGVIHDFEFIPKVFLRTAYNYDMDMASEATGLECLDPTLTQQQFAEEVDINTIVRNFGVTGMAPQNVRMPLQGDFTDVGSYQEALNQIMLADEAFAQMPADVRKRFDNDPGLFVEFTSDPKNREEVKKLGLLRPEEAPRSPIEVRVVPGDVPPGVTVTGVT